MGLYKGRGLYTGGLYTGGLYMDEIFYVIVIVINKYNNSDKQVLNKHSNNSNKQVGLYLGGLTFGGPPKLFGMR